MLHGTVVVVLVCAMGLADASPRPAPVVRVLPSVAVSQLRSPEVPSEDVVRDETKVEAPNARVREVLDPSAFGPPDPPAPPRLEFRVSWWHRDPLDRCLKRQPEPAEESRRTALPAAFVEARALGDENEPPRYPRRARRLGHQGTVLVAVLVAADGRLLEASLARPTRYPELNREALRAVRTWRFEPALRHGEAIAAHTEVEVVFQLLDR